MSSKQSLFYLLEKSFKLALSNIWRNKVLSLATIFVISVIIFIFNIILAINFTAENALTELNKKIDITVYFKETTTEEQIQSLIQEISQIKEVEKVTYISKDEALKQLKITHPDISLSFEKYNLQNPLPASLNITTKHPKYHEPLAKLLAQDNYKIYFSNIISANNNQSNPIINSVSKNLLKLNNFTNQVIFWLILIFVLGGTLIIMNALQLTIFTRKQEISVMKLVGASHWFIHSPFIIESIIYGIGAVSVSFLILIIVAKNIQVQETQLVNFYAYSKFYLIFIIELAATIFLSIFSSMIAIHEYLKKDLLEN